MARKFSEMTEHEWHPVYRRCMALADQAGTDEYAALSDKDRRKAMKERGFFFSNAAKFWSDLWVDFSKDMIDEEDIKATFWSGHVRSRRISATSVRTP